MMANYVANCPPPVKDKWPMADQSFGGQTCRMANNLRQEFLDFIARTGMTVAEFQRRSGVSYDALNKLKRRDGASTSAENADKIRRAIAEAGDGSLGGVAHDQDVDLVRVEPGDPVQSSANLIPVYDVAASAGHGAFVDYEAEAYSLAFPPSYLNKLTSSSPANLAIISVKGESMEPTLLDDDIVLLDTSKTNLSYDGLFVLRFNDALHVKRIGRSMKRDHVTIHSDNRDLYPSLEAPIKEVEAVGKVLWYGRKV